LSYSSNTNDSKEDENILKIESSVENPYSTTSSNEQLISNDSKDEKIPKIEKKRGGFEIVRMGQRVHEMGKFESKC